MLIKLVFKDLFEGKRVRIVGVYYDGLLDDGSGTVRAFFGESPPHGSRVDAIGYLENGRLYVERRRNIDLETEIRRRRKALSVVDEYLGDFNELVSRAERLIVKALSEGPKTYNELRLASRDEIGLEKAFEIALYRLLSSGEIIEIEPGLYSL